MDAKTVEARTHEFDVQDVEYLRHGDKPLLAKVYKPRGEGPFPALVDLHGGAWCLADRNTDKVRHEVLAGHGVVVVSLDWRTAREGAYPLALADINYAIRWVKLHAKELQDPARPRRHLRPVERRPSGDARRHAAQRSAIHDHFAAGRLAGARRHGESGRDVVAGDQSAQPLSACQAPGRAAQSAGLAAGNHRQAPAVLGRRGEHDRGQPDADPRARREGRAAAGDLAPGPRRRPARLQRRGLPSRRSPRPRASSTTTRRPAATSSCTTSTATVSPAIRRTSPRSATRSRKCWRSSASI